MPHLVSTQWLADNLGSDALVVLDGSYHLPAAGRDARAEYLAGHIPGARFVGFDTIADMTSGLDNTAPSADAFAARMGDLGVSDGSTVVIYDNSPHRTSARVWFLLKMFGKDAAILDGGLGKWQAEGRAEEQGEPEWQPAKFTAKADPAKLRDKAQMLANIDSRAEQVVDARGADRFTGEAEEIRPGMVSGHIPGSRNVPIGTLYEADGTMKDLAGIEAEFLGAGLDLGRPIVTSCGSGVTAANLSFALDRLGKPSAIYDGSWSEWAADPATPKATGPA
ncbi:sulfurtransferase [Croceicoccus naphthovorans]|uniref:3-mercaptopyruvate sulfurtransferase n=1 Tax=Croceicoccus naphthovorans TaxID=1348774 RepID=A0A0G3XJA8_9SPHN|nr:sulfurtransferase [Croceicoccus naphthovorans]AKM10689.1 3-mercaptopyruvate sulfurtransferase [Croceicoccus naphthovorans]MBB3992177.1 thiosulfate/3-mercaptopyruvate sulfurtransferase [Croceicoccus naphthovorans]